MSTRISATARCDSIMIPSFAMEFLSWNLLLRRVCGHCMPVMYVYKHSCIHSCMFMSVHARLCVRRSVCILSFGTIAKCTLLPVRTSTPFFFLHDCTSFILSFFGWHAVNSCYVHTCIHTHYEAAMYIHVHIHTMNMLCTYMYTYTL